MGLIEWFDRINPEVIFASLTGSLFAMWRSPTMPWWERLIYLFVGMVAAYFATTGANHLFNIGEGGLGVVGFASGICAIPLCDLLLKLARNPEQLIDWWGKWKKADKGE